MDQSGVGSSAGRAAAAALSSKPVLKQVPPVWSDLPNTQYHVTYTEHAKRKTVSAMDVVYALKRQGRAGLQFPVGRIHRLLRSVNLLDFSPNVCAGRTTTPPE